ncbi:MAG: xylulokinase, partial [Clostridiales bacterium]|nr:xylulokinase [Clostridiales bacterium]
MFYLGIDLGTSSIKALLADEAGRVLDSESEGYPLLLPRENWSEQEPEAWWEGFCKIMKRLGGRHDLR